MEILVLPAPRCAALMVIESPLNSVPTMMILKYVTAMSSTSSPAPAKIIIGRAKKYPSALRTMAITALISIEKRRQRLASNRSIAPFLRATIAVTETLSDMMVASTIIFRLIGRAPTAAMAPEPSAETMMVSITPTSPTSTASNVDGQAMRNAVW